MDCPSCANRNGKGGKVAELFTEGTGQDLAAPLSQVLSDGSTTYLYGRERLRALDGAW